MSNEVKRTIKLLCPSLSKEVLFVAWEEQKLDLGSIARIFELEPATLRLNGYFIARGVDLIASSVTWKSLLSYFSGRGLSTGKYDSDALIVDGKLCKTGSKRSCDSQDAENGMVDLSRKQELDVFNLIKKKSSYASSRCGDGQLHLSKENGLCSKRNQQWLEDGLLKRLKTSEAKFGALADSRRRGNYCSSIISKVELPCSRSLKRRREEEEVMVVGASGKKLNTQASTI